MTWDIPKEYLDVEAEKERIDKKQQKDKKKKKVSSHLSRQSVQIEKTHSTGTEFQEDYIK